MNKVKKSKTRKYSKSEISLLYLQERVPTLEIVKRLSLDKTLNVLDHIDLDLTPYLKLPISLIGKSRIEWIYLIAPTQAGKTLFLQIAVADCIDQNPGTMLYILPDKVSGQKAIENKIISLIKDNDFLMEHSRTTRGSTGLTMSSIHLDNMIIYPGWSGSLASLSSTPAKTVILDEVRLMKLNIGEESNAVKLANDRVTTYRSFGMGQGLAVSTPSIEGDLLHQQVDIKGTTICKWAYTCPKCGHLKVLDFFKNFEQLEGQDKVKVFCRECGYEFSDKNMKKDFNKNGAYYTEKNGSLELVKPEELSGRVVFWFDSIASPFRSFQAIMNEFLRTKNKLHDYRNFWQAWLARFWIDDISKTSRESLEMRKVDEGVGIVPNWTKVITAGVDSQKAGFYVVVRAWGVNRKTRVIDAFFIESHSLKTTSDDVTKSFRDKIENRIFTDLDGVRWKIALWGIDTGGERTKQLYYACADLEKVVMVKGRNMQQMSIQYNPKINLYLVRTSEYLEESEERSLMDTFEIASGIDMEYYSQFINARKVNLTNKKTGEKKIIWKKTGQNDYRMADIHSFICLDIETEVGTFRRELDKDDFKYNPLEIKVINDVSEKETTTTDPQDVYDDNDDYDITSSLNNWWD